MSNKIIFKALTEVDYKTFPKPYPASQNIPEWWKKQTPYEQSVDNPTGGKVIVDGRRVNASFKKCTPMLDAITSGYIVPLCVDVQVRQTSFGPKITWKTKREIFEIHGENSENVLPPIGYSNSVFKYLNTWIPITPNGYSVAITAPVGHRNLPFHAIPAIIDSDKSVIDIVPPMWLMDGFEGIVEKGTPMFQITPFKRESWKSEFEYLADNEFYINQEKTFNSTIVNHYIKNIWHKKEYR